MELKPTLVLGASTHPNRYSNLALKRLHAAGHPVVAIGKTTGRVDGIVIQTQPVPFPDIHTVTLYLNPTHQVAYYPYILSLRPKRLIFNPGTENDDLKALAEQNGIPCLEACTLVMLSSGQF